MHLDVLFWKPGWVGRDDLEFRALVTEALAQPAWIMDGDFAGSWDLRMPAADTIVWIDQPRSLCLFRAISRAVTYRHGGRNDLAPGCPEKFDPAFYRFIWTYDAKVRPRLQAALAAHGGAARVVRLCSDTEIAAFVASV